MYIEVKPDGEITVDDFAGTATCEALPNGGVRIKLDEECDEFELDDEIVLTPFALAMEETARQLFGKRGAL